jgi:transposase
MLGIDVSKHTLACALLDPQTRQFQWQKQFPNTEAGIRQLLERVAPDVPWVLEPTGRYSLLAVRLARAAGRQVLMAQPREAQFYLKSRQSRAKTDRLDSRGLALYALSEPLPLFPLKSDLVERLDQLLAARKGLAQAQAMLLQQLRELTHAAACLEAALTALRAEQKELDRQIAELTRATEEFKAVAELQDVPGIGPVTAASVVSRLRSRSFARGGQFVAYVGLDIRVLQSGKRQGQRGLTKKGDAELRRLLFLCARASLRSPDGPFREQYQRELAKGLSKTAATCVIARKIARMCWSMVKHDTRYDPLRVYSQPPTDPSRQKAA